MNKGFLQPIFGDSVIFDPAVNESLQPLMVLIPDLLNRVVHAWALKGYLTGLALFTLLVTTIPVR